MDGRKRRLLGVIGRSRFSDPHYFFLDCADFSWPGAGCAPQHPDHGGDTTISLVAKGDHAMSRKRFGYLMWTCVQVLSALFVLQVFPVAAEPQGKREWR
ncbi:MAG: hypothetical protein MPW14_25440 (plasmid) [Candidatus Manganitrophus sp.]|nr:MAG: hypothetical protein MPW14_25440 [Candidatus Manganitrophus sp.]